MGALVSLVHTFLYPEIADTTSIDIDVSGEAIGARPIGR